MMGRILDYDHGHVKCNKSAASRGRVTRPITRLTVLTISAVVAMAAAGQVSGAGFALIENSASGQGNAYAGGAAIADDPATIYFNPAGMTRLPDRELTVAGHVISPQVKFRNEGSTAATGGLLSGSDGGGGSTSFVPSFYYLHPLENAFTLGLGITVPFGLTTEYDDDWVGRYHAVKSSVATVNINPSLAWQANEKLSLGAGLSVQYIDVELTSAIDFGAVCVAQEGGGLLPPGTCSGLGANPQKMDGFADLQADNISWGFNLGLLYEFTPQTRVGLAYRSQVKQRLEGRAEFTVPSAVAFLKAADVFVDSDIKASVDLPDTFSLSVYHALSQKVALMADWTWTHWSNFNELRIRYNSSQPDSVTTENWNDNNRYAVGANYRFNDKLKLRGGLAYDETPVPNGRHRSPRLPGNDRTWLSLGAGYMVSQTLSVDVGYSHLFVDDAESDHAYESSVPTLRHTLKGEYKAAVDIFSAQLNWKF